MHRRTTSGEGSRVNPPQGGGEEASGELGKGRRAGGRWESYQRRIKPSKKETNTGFVAKEVGGTSNGERGSACFIKYNHQEVISIGVLGASRQDPIPSPAKGKG